MKASLRCLLVVVLVGDFDLDEDAFKELRRLGYSTVPDNQPTSLRRRRRDGPGDDLASESARIFYETAPFWEARSGVLDRTARFSSLTNPFGETSGPATSWVSAFHPLPHRFETREEAQKLVRPPADLCRRTGPLPLPVLDLLLRPDAPLQGPFVRLTIGGSGAKCDDEDDD